METKNKTLFTKDLENKKIVVEREFSAPVESVWKAWTDSSLLDQWWAPRPWRAETKSMDFRPGGFWLYAMKGPDNEVHWARVDYRSIEKLKNFQAGDYFCDENGNKNDQLPNMDWNNQFSKTDDGTKVVVNISFKSEADISTIVEMGFQEGFDAALGNLDELLEK